MVNNLLKIMDPAIKDLTGEVSARHSIHQLIHELKERIPISSLAVIVKDPKTENLVMANRYQISDSFARSFSRRVGTHKINELMYKEEYLIFNQQDNPEVCQEFMLLKEYHTGIAVRLEAEHRPRGYMVMFFDQPFTPDEDTKTLLIALGRICAINFVLEKMYHRVAELCRFDRDSGLMTYQFFCELLEEEMRRAERYQTPLALALIDLDNFKDITNIYGLESAQQVYRDVAADLKIHLKNPELVGRYGPDEIIISLPETGAAPMPELCKFFQDAVKYRKYTTKSIATTISIAATALQTGDDINSLLQRLQVAFHETRCQGDGQVVIH